MPAQFTLKKGDTEPKLRAVLQNADLTAINLTAATAVKFIMKVANASPASAAKVNATATFVDKPNGIVEYVWAVGDTDTVGLYQAEFEVSWGGRLQTVPGADYFTVQVVQDLG